MTFGEWMMDLTWILIVVAVIQTILAAPTFIRELATFRRKKQVFGQGVWRGWHKTKKKLAG
jgi:type IV secretory pathway VirB2 component (pilin)